MLEKSFKSKEKICDVDNERFVNLDPQDLYQARKDAPDRRRMVRRGGEDQKDDDDSNEDQSDSEQEQDDSSDDDDAGELVHMNV